MGNNRTIKCRQCLCVDIEKSKCNITGRDVTLDSERHCKLGGLRPERELKELGLKN